MTCPRCGMPVTLDDVHYVAADEDAALLEALVDDPGMIDRCDDLATVARMIRGLGRGRGRRPSGSQRRPSRSG